MIEITNIKVSNFYAIGDIDLKVTNGIFKVTGSGNITAGDPLTNADCATAGTPVNRVEKAATNTESILGTALESSTDGQTLKMEVRVVGMELA